MMNIIYMGTPEFAVPSLQSLIQAGHTLSAVFTQPDKPKGRGYTLTPPPVKVCALEHDIPVYQPSTLKSEEAFQIIKELSPDVIVVVAYGKILPKNIIEYPKYGCINVHGSLLPKYRGAAPIQRAVLNGETETGITTMKMDVGLDTGDMLLKTAVEIGKNETSGQLHDRLAVLGAGLIVETLAKLEQGTVKPEKQDDSLSNYAAMLDKSLCPIDWNKSNVQIHNQIRGLMPWPVATTMIKGKKLKLFGSRIAQGTGAPGEVVCTEPLTVACGTGALELLEVQLEGKKRMDSSSFMLGHKIETGDLFG